jgi:glutathione-regulated potassium-efflux system ancillary protein KefC
MQQLFTIAAVWLALAVVAAVIAYRLRIAIALVEICVGVVVAAIATHYGWFDRLGSEEQWLRFLASTGAVMLTFLAGAELDPAVIRTKLTEVSVVGVIGFLAPFLVCAAVAHWVLGWDSQASLLAGVALSTTSMAVVYSVMLETGFNRTEFGKGILGACFINDLGTVIALGLLFAPFTYKTIVFIVVAAAVIAALPFVIDRMAMIYGHRTAAIRTKVILIVLLGLGALAYWSGSEAVLPAYIVGMVLAGGAAQDHHWIRRLRTFTVGFLTPFYFLRAGMLVSVSAVVAAPVAVLVLFAAKVGAKIFGLYPVIGRFRRERRERWYYTLMMSTGLTFGTISALYGLSHGIVTQSQYSYLVAVVIGTAVVPTVIASLAFVPRHLLPKAPAEVAPAAAAAPSPVPGAAAVGEAVMRALRDVEAPFVDNELLAAALDELDLEQEEEEEVADEG